MRRPAAALLLTLALAACDRDPSELAREINEARAGCTEEKLRAADEECIRMMERYAGMGTEAMEGYVGAVKSLDQALQRMPAARFDTTMGHALSSPPPAASSGTSGGPESYRAEAYPTERSLADAAPLDLGGGRWSDDPGPRRDYDDRSDGGRWSDHPTYDGYGYDPRYIDPRYVDPRFVDPRYSDPRYGVDPRGYGGRGFDPRYGRDPYQDPRARRFPSDPRAGGLRPPEDRLRRPWLEDEAIGRYDARISADTAARLRPRRRRNEE